MQQSLQSVAHLSLINRYLDALLSRRISTAAEMSPRYETLWREIARISGFGKRLRPLMVIQSYEAFGGSDVSRIIPAAAACELLHISMLIHDDIIDRDLVRHGEPTIEAAYQRLYASEVSDKRIRTHNARGAALLAGDLLLSEARGLITKCEAAPDALRHAGYAFEQAVMEVAGGELLDVEAAHAPRGSIDPLSVMAYKTASYSFIAPLTIGAILAGALPADRALIRSFALNLGIAYQLTDDILGVFGNTDETGKSTSGDISEGKATYLVQQFYALADHGMIEEFERYYGKRGVTPEDSRIVRDLLTASGALHESEALIQTYVTRARHDLAALTLAPKYADDFEQLIVRSTNRKA